MVAVAIIALILAVGLCLQRRALFLERAEWNAWEAQGCDVHRQTYMDGTPYFNEEFFEADGTVKELYGRLFERARGHYAALERKYRYAGAHPWLGVEPDPPEPR